MSRIQAAQLSPDRHGRPDVAHYGSKLLPILYRNVKSGLPGQPQRPSCTVDESHHHRKPLRTPTSCTRCSIARQQRAVREHPKGDPSGSADGVEPKLIARVRHAGRGPEGFLRSGRVAGACSLSVLILCSGHGGQPDELESLIAEALMRDFAFRPKRRNWTATAEQDRRRAHLRGCDPSWTLRLALAAPPTTPPVWVWICQALEGIRHATSLAPFALPGESLVAPGWRVPVL
jgi:hypothetical protein